MRGYFPTASFSIPHVAEAPNLNTDPNSATWARAASAWIEKDCSQQVEYPKIKTEVRGFWTDSDLYLLFVSPYSQLNLWLPANRGWIHGRLWYHRSRLAIAPCGPEPPEFRAQNLATRIGAQTRELILAGTSVVASVGLFWHHSWARKLALGLLLVQAFYGSEAFAWGFSSGPPKPRVRLFSRFVVAAWKGLWFYLIYRLVL